MGSGFGNSLRRANNPKVEALVIFVRNVFFLKMYSVNII